MKRGSFAEEALASMIDRIYGAAVEPSEWPNVLTEITNWYGGWGVQLLSWDNASQTMPFSVAGGDITVDGQRAYGEHYGKIDPRRQLLDRMPVGRLVACNSVFDDAYVASSEFYQDFLLPLGGRYLSVASLASERNITTIIGLHRGPKDGGFERADVDRLGLLLPHLSRASRLHRTLDGLRLIASGATAALDALSMGIAILNARGNILFGNTALRAIAQTADGIGLRANQISIEHPAQSARLRELIARAGTRSLDGINNAGGSTQVTRPSGKRPYSVMVIRLPQDLPTFAGRQAALLVVVQDPATSPPDISHLLRSLYGLTPREASLAMRLSDGSTLLQVADKLGITEGTARVHMTSVYAKLGVSRQAELVRLLSPFFLHRHSDP